MALRTSLIVSLIASLLGCGESHDPGDDAGVEIRFDANFPDAGFDAGPPPSNVGTECTGDEDCVGPANTCITDEQGLPGGYCTAVCSTDEECPANSACIAIQMGLSVCLQTCDPASAEDQCRAGYGCSPAGGGAPPLCLPGCEDDSDCGEGLQCQVGGGFSGSGACFDPAAGIGDECTTESDCPENGLCRVAEEGWPGGSCTTFGCDFETGEGCPGDGECVALGRFALCIDGCTADTDCREGYSCIPSLGFPDRMTCQPTFDEDSLGAPCSARRDPCLGGFCLSEGQYGYPDSYCIAIGCDFTMTPSGCPGDGACVESAGGTGVCFDGCTTTDDCRAGYTCRRSDPEDPASALACLPGCESDAECANDDAVCNTGTGLCGEAFNPASLGEPCGSDEDCAGGRCMTEAFEGWPAGTCTYPGCRLDGAGMSATCPTGSVCTDDGAGDPDLGVCVEACDAGAEPSTCRPGYACVPFAGAEGACRPDCASDSCGSGFTCNDTSGLCESGT